MTRATTIFTANATVLRTADEVDAFNAIYAFVAARTDAAFDAVDAIYAFVAARTDAAFVAARTDANTIPNKAARAAARATARADYDATRAVDAADWCTAVDALNAVFANANA